MLGVLAALYLTVAPAQIGGPARYVVITGTSMNPLLYRGDLAVVRERSTYDVGDAVLYESRSLRANVLHRIKARDGDRLVLRGDNNDFDDGERPLPSQVKGEYWFRVPGLGSILAWFQKPLHAAIFLGALVLLAMGGGGAKRRGRRGRGGPGGRSEAAAGDAPWVVPASEAAGGSSGDARRPGRLVDPAVLLMVAACLAGVSALLLVVTAGKPRMRSATVPDATTHAGSFSYSATTPRSVVYPDGRVRSGGPVFVRLVRDLDVRFAYAFASKAKADVGGRISMSVRLSDGQGWERRLPVAPARRFDGTRATAAGTLDVRALVRLVEQMRRLTGSNVTQVAVSLEPVVELDGAVGGEAADDRFVPSLRFTLDAVALRSETSPGTAGPVDVAGDVVPTVDPMNPVERRPGTVDVPAAVALGPLEVSVSDARLAGLAGLVVALLVGVWGVLARRRGGGRSEHERVAGRLGELLVESRSPVAEGRPVTDVADVESVVQLAERYDRVVLHRLGDEGHEYVVDDGSMIYRYRSEASGDRAAQAA